MTQSARQFTLMFDLEETIIGTWSNGIPNAKGIQKIQNWLIAHTGYTDDAGLFSFAIDFDYEKEQGIRLAANALHKTWLGNLVFNLKLTPCFKELEKLPLVAVDGLQKWEIVNLFAKERMFDLWARQFPNRDFILFDDSLELRETTITRTLPCGCVQTIILVKV